MNSPQDAHQKMELLTIDSQTMLVLAQQGQWDELVEMEVKRRLVLEDFFETLPDQLKTKIAGELRQFIEQLLEIDQQIMMLSGKAKIDAAGEVQNIQAGSLAVKAYNDNKT